MNRLFPFLIFSLLLLSGCTDDDDPCEAIVCLNGGTCESGVCDCPQGYSGVQCEVFDACEEVVCFNDGTCVNGVCDCAEGYTGPSCASQIIPQSISISRIDVTGFPQNQPNGTSWDSASGPDIYPELSKGAVVIWETTDFIQNAVSGQDYTFELSPSEALTAPTDEYTLSLLDFDDVEGDDSMGAVTFTPYNSTNGFPTEINVDDGSGLAFTIYVFYTF